MSHQTATQITFLNQVKSRLNSTESLAEIISEELNISSDSAYRRIRGETALTIEEAKILAIKYKISLDSLFNSSNSSVSFDYFSIQKDSLSFESYYLNILKSIETIDSGQKKQITYAAKDIPIFHFFHFPELAAFKLYFWMRTVLNFPAMDSNIFSKSMIDEKLILLGQKILSNYIRIPTIELWNEETINSTVNQLRYSFESGIVSKADYQLLIQKLHLLIEHIQKQAATGSKYYAGKEPIEIENNYRFFINEIVLSDNTILAQRNNLFSIYLPHNAINFLVTTNQSFCKETSLWLDNLQKRSTLISQVSERERNKFFLKIHKKIDQLNSI